MSLYKSKQGEWGVRWHEGGKHRSRLIGTKADAQAYDEEVRRRKRMGGVSILAGDISFTDFTEKWWEAHAPTVAESTQASYLTTINKHVLPYLGGYSLNELSPQTVDAYRAEMERNGVGRPTQAKALAVLHAICQKAVLWEKLAYNPVAAVKKPTGYRQRIVQPFPPEKVEELRAGFGPMHQTFISLLAYAGCRPHEALALTWGDVMDEGIIFRPTKHGTRERTTRLLAPLSDDLRAWKTESGVMVGKVFDWTQGGLRNWSRKQFRPACERIGVEATRPYDLRHGFVTLLLGEGHGLAYVADQLGHSIATCERWYAHLSHVEGGQSAEERIYEARRRVGATTQREAANG